MFCVSSRAWSWAAWWLLVGLSSGAGCQRSATTPQTDAAGTGGTSSTAYENPASIAFEPLAHHPRLELSNLRFSKGLGGSEAFAIDWKVTSGEPVPGTMLVVKQPGGRPMMEMSVPMWANETSGTIEGAVETFGFSDSGPRLESGCEMYLAALEGNARHKISNSVTTGGVSTSSTRQATADELAKFATPSAEDLATLPQQSVSQPDAATVPPTGSESPPTPVTGQTPASAAGEVTEAELSTIPADLEIPVGTRLRALYANDWKPVTVLADQPDGKLKIHWDGYSDSWDEAKSRGDLRIETAILTKLLGGRSAGSTVGSTTARSPSTDTSTELDANQLAQGQKLEAQWGQQWLPVTVKRVLPDGTVEIHWDGYSDSFDEALPLTRLRRP